MKRNHNKEKNPNWKGGVWKKNPVEYYQKYSPQYYQKNKAKIKAYHHQWYLAHKEEESQKKKRQYKNNPQKYKDSSKKYYQKLDKEKKREYNKRYYLKHKDERRQAQRKVRVKRNKAEGFHTLQEWENLKKRFNYQCAICSKKEPEIKLTIDHIIPLSKNGTDYIKNIQPLCRNCNSKKGNKV